VVADGGTQDIRIFSPGVRNLCSIGGTGGGPQEFRALAALARTAGDTIRAYDMRLSRVSVESPDCTFVRSRTLAQTGDPELLRAPVGWFFDGRIVLRSSRVPPIPGGEGDLSSLNGMRNQRLPLRTRVTVILFNQQGVVAHSLGPWNGDERILELGAGAVSIGPRPFGRSLQTVVNGSTLAVGATDAFEIRLFDPHGTLRRIIRSPGARRAVTQEDIDTWLASRLAAIPNPAERRRERAMYEAIQFPDSIPAFRSLFLDDTGDLWVREYQPTENRGPVRWRVYDRRGYPLAHVAGPERFRPTDIGRHYVLGIRKDDLDVEHVELYELERIRR